MIRGFLLSCLLAAISTSALAEDLVVIAATNAGEAFKPGAIVSTGTAVKLPQGSRLTLLSKGGEVLRLAGPYSSVVDLPALAGDAPKEKAWASTLSSIADVVSKKVVRTNVVGTSRAVIAPMALIEPDVWQLTVDSSGHRCLNSAKSNLWRKNASKSLTIDLRSQEAQQKGLTWPVGINHMDLPKKFMKDGTLVVMKIDAQPRRFNIHVLPADIEADQWGDVLHWMVSKECTRQANLLVGRLHNGLGRTQ